MKRVKPREGMRLEPDFGGRAPMYVFTQDELDRLVARETARLRQEVDTLRRGLRRNWKWVEEMSAAQRERRRKAWRESKRRTKAKTA